MTAPEDIFGEWESRAIESERAYRLILAVLDDKAVPFINTISATIGDETGPHPLSPTYRLIHTLSTELANLLVEVQGPEEARNTVETLLLKSLRGDDA